VKSIPTRWESIGSWKFPRKLHTAMTAHPKIDPTPANGVLAYMASGAFSADVMMHKVNPRGNSDPRACALTRPYSSMVRLRHHKELHSYPGDANTGSLDRAMVGGPSLRLDPEGVYLGVLPRHGGTAENIRWWKWT